VNIGQIIFSIRAKEIDLKQVVEALRRTKYKFPGRQNIIVSNKWGFTNHTFAEYKKLQSQERFVDKGTHVKVRNGHGTIPEDANGCVLTF